ncbi:glycosyltransferase family 2 protein [Desulfoluna spongiiphila]|uniref:Glycosyltransferase involved in cell wall bisynthesis n=1 Tax=Desulfoluna spongiiphila TaxID=419481 RepID=A0A1G5JE77_9BACT|nr:glycosyltransferase family 2 protein [Desulfoluna spongiiphila]SCY86241.1 Glycosyltransferase involved in cell wall bisynthesis [Desulfoluna spongiiphila]
MAIRNQTLLNPFFSIITASYNAEKSINRTLLSIRKQKFKNFEHIIIDGDSTDQTLSIIRHYSDKYNLRYISEKDRGISDAMNKGIKLSKGQYIIFIHADDELADENTLNRVFSDISSTKSSVYAYSILFKHKTGMKIAHPICIPYWYKLRNTIPHQGAFVHRDTFYKFGFFDTSFSISMDYKFFYTILLSGEPVQYSRSIVSIMGSQGISSAPSLYQDRIKQEFEIQNSLENSLLWKILQKLFQKLYYIYKINIILHLKKGEIY